MKKIVRGDDGACKTNGTATMKIRIPRGVSKGVLRTAAAAKGFKSISALVVHVLLQDPALASRRGIVLA